MATRRPGTAWLLSLACAVLGALALSLAGRANDTVTADERARIDAPADGTAVSGRIDIRATVAVDPADLDFYRIYVGNGRSPSAMRPIGPPRTVPATNEVLATLDTTLLLAGEATIELRVYLKQGDPINATTVVVVQVGPTPTRTFSGPVVTVPPVAVAPSQQGAGSVSVVEAYPAASLPDVEIPQFGTFDPTPIPIRRLTPDNVYDTLPTDPVQDDPLLRDLPSTPIPLPTPNLAPIPR